MIAYNSKRIQNFCCLHHSTEKNGFLFLIWTDSEFMTPHNLIVQIRLIGDNSTRIQNFRKRKKLNNKIFLPGSKLPEAKTTIVINKVLKDFFSLRLIDKKFVPFRFSLFSASQWSFAIDSAHYYPIRNMFHGILASPTKTV